MAQCDSCKANKVCDHNKYGFENCNNFIPDTDVVGVVRCMDCKYSREYKCKNDPCYRFLTCQRREHYTEGVDEYDFCSYGERKVST